MWRPGQRDQAPGGCQLPWAPITDSLGGPRRRASLQLPAGSPGRPKAPGLRAQLHSEDAGEWRLVHHLPRPTLRTIGAVSASTPPPPHRGWGGGGGVLGHWLVRPAKSPETGEAAFAFYCSFHPAFSQLIYEVGVSRGCSEWMGVGAPGHSLVELPVGPPSSSGPHRERASGRGRYVGGGWLRTPLLEFKAICVRGPAGGGGELGVLVRCVGPEPQSPVFSSARSFPSLLGSTKTLSPPPLSLFTQKCAFVLWYVFVHEPSISDHPFLHGGGNRREVFLTSAARRSGKGKGLQVPTPLRSWSLGRLAWRWWREEEKGTRPPWVSVAAGLQAHVCGGCFVLCNKLLEVHEVADGGEASVSRGGTVGPAGERGPAG